jgi:hypothetical protein
VNESTIVFTHAWDQLVLNHANSKNIVFQRVAPCEVIQEVSGFRIPLLGFRILLLGFRIPHLGFRNYRGFRIPITGPCGRSDEKFSEYFMTCEATNVFAIRKMKTLFTIKNTHVLRIDVLQSLQCRRELFFIGGRE